jgi:radical SAM protein with 4Fe4S-binding SPASM domain
MENLDYLLKRKEHIGSALPTLRVTFVETEENVLEKNAFMEYWSERANSVDIQKQHNFDVIGEPKETPRAIKCSFPWRSIMILANGEVLPCCSFYAVGSNTMGNIDTSSIKDIWDSRIFKDFRMNMKQGIYSDACKLCFDAQQ